MNQLWNTYIERQDQLLNALIEHIQISFIALLFAMLVAIPLAIFLTRHPKWAEPIIGTSAVLQTIPSLALLGLLIPLVGIGKVPAIIALVLYALLPILRNTYTGIKEIDPALIEAARAMGMNLRKRLLRVEFPLALPVMMAGIRTAMVLIVGTATLAALIGAGGLGKLILLGIDRNDNMLIVLGAIPTALLALLFDVMLRVAERVSQKGSLKSAGIAMLAAIMFIGIPMAWGTGQKDLVIAGKLGSEPEILIQMYKQLIEQDTNLKVEVKPGFGKTSFVFHALEAGEIDMYPEFTGTAITTFLKQEAISTERGKVYEQAKQGMADQFGMVLLQPMDYNNTYALAVPSAIAEQYQLNAISDLKQTAPLLKAGFTLEFSDREDGYKGIQHLYGIQFPNLVTMEPMLRYSAVETGDITLIDAYSTDSELRQYGLKVLEDDKSLFPPYQGAPLMRRETLAKYPELENTLNKLSGKITDEDMRTMNYKVNVESIPAEKVARDFLQQAGILS
ncbi:ABC transporter permease/substrate-binding protein [Paenibacillus apiarius]|uniref:ABC transporter permease/substrate-binding protein n=1 Tax=Paenibacillus apiarius TaxID=46240 RepID=A0ABT4DML0_9BACL|nr:ABC transporter permease/substrate-binding protein [Paenibacillus apiarius]MCY9514607.1 ABC transporter permease/substrate-binding protein [Paenibacillus apiarius]MCY9518597.1 ABC transporter permease/substrate-binding protein [Paenibacillus apiarius]MCY9552685.1 ABC transporter permease/substrate-binding protein [Paenibacillus apiarius]MCY9556987.1 ABC transporter permease/substrate-binding protein [Paenibacillus apiarius]MCY9686060.1 ABC transporter permease/substrate-binding protein [Pae